MAAGLLGVNKTGKSGILVKNLRIEKEANERQFFIQVVNMLLMTN